MLNKKSEKPNIVFILCDDMGLWSLGCAGNKEIRTPNLDKLAESGILFNNFFCASPVCSPARASIFTGKIPSQHGVQDWLENDDIEYLNGQSSFVHVLAENGYTCGISGKWHLGNAMKKQMGFSHWYVFKGAQGTYYDMPMVVDNEVKTQKGYITDLITDDALDFINVNAKSQSPFYLSVHYTAPHKPWINCHPEEIVKSYDDCDFLSIPNDPMHKDQINTHPFPVGEERKETLKGYFAAVTSMDTNIGRLIEAIENQGLRENTLIFFMSDNGMNMGHHGIFGKGNGTFPMNLFDTSVKVPAIVSHLGHIRQGVVVDNLLSQYDFMPTILEYAGIHHNNTDNLPGRSFCNVLSGNEYEENKNVVIFDEYGPVRMIRSKQYKYIHKYPYGPHEFYDLVNDPDEKINLYSDESKQKIVEQMKYSLEDWFLKYVDPEIDACREPIYGKGQRNLAGVWGKGKKAFLGGHEFLNKNR
jgi:choline-sulfatase